MFDLVVFLALLVLGYTAGSMAERRHFRSIEVRERASRRLPVVTCPQGAEAPLAGGVRKIRFVSGSAVISVDYFKRFLAGLRMIFGGRVSAYESLLDRARREAILRMKEQAVGAHALVGMRIETSTIAGRGRGNKGVATVEALAYGTAVWLDGVPSPAA